jgi:hypothetical protein
MPDFELWHSCRKLAIRWENEVTWKLFQTFPFNVLTTQCLTICIWSTTHHTRRPKH